MLKSGSNMKQFPMDMNGVNKIISFGQLGEIIPTQKGRGTWPNNHNKIESCTQGEDDMVNDQK